MYCRHRGTYPVGVKSVTVTDFLGFLPSPTHDVPGPPHSQAPHPSAGTSQPGTAEKGPQKHTVSHFTSPESADYEVRRYQSGDPKKYIHWKNSARTGELLVRRQMPEELFETILMLDLSPVQGDTEKRLQTEDNILEAALSYLQDCYLKKIPVRVVYMDSEIREILIDVCTGFEAFYENVQISPLNPRFLLRRYGAGTPAVWQAPEPTSSLPPPRPCAYRDHRGEPASRK